jgi:predicted RNase H-like HicB family nuclease
MTSTPTSTMPAPSAYTFEIVIEREPGEGYVGYSPTLPGCFTRGATLEEVRTSLRLAVQREVRSLVERGEPVRQNEKLVHVEVLMITPLGLDGESPGRAAECG